MATRRSLLRAKNEISASSLRSFSTPAKIDPSKPPLIPRTSRADIFKPTFGPPGRSANSGITATVFGAYGFVGRYYMNELGSVGSRAYVPFRGCEMEVRHLKPMFDLGQLGLIPFSPRDEASIIESIQHSDIVVNLIGKYYETKHAVPTRRADGSLSRINYSFKEVHEDIPRRLARLSREAGVKAFVHMSALSANQYSLSEWSRSKANGEIAVREEFPEATIVRSAQVFGPEDKFLNYIAESMERMSVSFVVDGGQTAVQPVYVNDVGEALMIITKNWEQMQGKTVELAGPAEYTYKEIYELISDLTYIKRPIIDVPVPVARAAGHIAEQLMQPFFTADTIDQLVEDNLPSKHDDIITITDLGIKPASMDKVAFDYLHRYRQGGHFLAVKGYH